VEALTWYADKYLPAAAKDFDAKFREENLMTSAVEVWGEKYTAVSIQSEAFGHFMYSNCYSKWKLYAKNLHQNHKWKIPKHNKEDKESLKFHKTKYSNRNAGRNKGWNPSTATAHNELLKKVKAFRTDDKKNKYKMARMVRELIRKNHNLSVFLSKKRKAQEDAQVVAMRPMLEQHIINISDDPDSSSEVESDGSSELDGDEDNESHVI